MNENSSYECAESLRTAAKILKGVGIALVCIGVFTFLCTLAAGAEFIVGIGLTSLIAGVISFFIFWVFSLFCSAMAEITMNTQVCANCLKAAHARETKPQTITREKQKMIDELPQM
ncbi:MAG: hypothetical protein LUG52_03590 [Clostridia bacterium]|nr:hypothetical protein [Clostridia bacterium]